MMQHFSYMGGSNGALHYTYSSPTMSVDATDAFYYPCALLSSSVVKPLPPDRAYPAPDALPPSFRAVPPAPLSSPAAATAAAAAGGHAWMCAPAVPAEAERKALERSGATSDLGMTPDGSLQASDVLLSDILRDLDGSTTGDDRDREDDGRPADPWAVPAPVSAVSVSAAAPAPGRAESPNALLRLIASLRAEMTDEAVGSRVRQLPWNTCVQLVAALAEIPQVMLGLCINSRGNIVVHLAERLGSDIAAPLVSFVRRNLRHLAVDRNGCIALPRIMDIASDAQLDAFFAETIANVHTLAVDMYGNYVVKYFVTFVRSKRYVSTLLHEYIFPHLVHVATNKFGSHVLENTIKNGGVEALMSISLRLFNDREALRVCAFDRFANYCVQSCLRNLRTLDSGMFQLCSVNVLRVLDGSPYEKNIVKQMGRNFARFTSLSKGDA